MKAATVKQLKEELTNQSKDELVQLCLRMSKFKKESKELLTYLLYEQADEQAYIESVKAEVDAQFQQINKKSYYYIKKSVRKILLMIKKYIRYSQKKETEVDLLIYFCTKLKAFRPSIRNTGLQTVYERQVQAIKKIISTLHEDLQYDYESELEKLR